MTSVVDTSVLVDFLRGLEPARVTMEAAMGEGAHASEITRVEVLAGMRTDEEVKTRALLSTLEWHPVDAAVAEEAGRLGRRWLPSHSGIDAADLVIAATALVTGSGLLTTNVRHFPMFVDLTAPY